MLVVAVVVVVVAVAVAVDGVEGGVARKMGDGGGEGGVWGAWDPKTCSMNSGWVREAAARSIRARERDAGLGVVIYYMRGGGQGGARGGNEERGVGGGLAERLVLFLVFVYRWMNSTNLFWAASRTTSTIPRMTRVISSTRMDIIARGE